MKEDLREALRVPYAALTPVVLLGIAQAIALGALIVLVWRVIDDVILAVRFAQPLGPVYRLLALLAVVALVSALLRATEFRIAERIGYEFVRKLRMAMYAHLQGMAPRQIQYRSRGSLILRFTGDLTMFRTWISRGLSRGIVAGIMVLGGAVVLFVLNPWLSLTMLSFLFMGSALSLSLGRRLRGVTRVVRRKRSALTSNVDEQVHSLAVVQVFRRSAGEYVRLSRQNDSLTRTLFREAAMRARLRGVSTGTGLLAAVAVMAVGVYEIDRGRATLGLIVAAVYAARALATPVRNIGLAHDYWQRAHVSRSKILDFLGSRSRDLDQPGLEKLRVRRARVEFRNVSVEGALREISATAPPGELVAIMGPTGAGKSTLLSLLARFIEPDQGEVVINGRPLSDFTIRSTYRNVGIVSPDLPLMRGTIRRNLTYRKRTASEEEVQRVVLACRLDEILTGLPGGLDSWVTEGGKNLSMGQRQRIALGRALMGNPPLLLLDEPTANLDPESKDVFHRVMTRHLGTVLLVTHDSAEAALADQVWRMESGRVVEVLSGEEYRDRQWLSRHGGMVPRSAAST
ncbi:MAG: ABC transporter ATP-binding protein [Gemmatimonadetes bacterium]|nr:ABC transporter ATP-binding protein [Gemmatimonadota bacterium]